MRDVARRAGVSQSTVSVVVNDRHEVGISDETKARVHAVIDELGFRPNLAARGLRLQRTSTIGFVTDHIASSPYAGRIVQGAHDAAWGSGHLLLLVNTGGDPGVETAAVEALLDRQVDGLLYAAMVWRRIDLPASFATVPSILVNGWSDGSAGLSADHPAVLAQELTGGRLAAQVLVEAGHTEIAFLGGPQLDAATAEREQGFREVMAEASLTVRPEWVRYGTYDLRSGYRLTQDLFERGPRPTALVCGNDTMAAAAIGSLRSFGLDVPRDVSVVGYDDLAGLADQLRPGLTTVSIPHYEMGRAAVRALLGSLSTGAPPVSVRVGGELVRRESVAAPARR